MKTCLLSACLLLLAGLPASAARISEILFNPEGTDGPNEYVEIFGTPNAVIAAGTYLVGVEGDVGANIGDVQTIFDLGGLTFGSNGFLVFAQRNNTYTFNAAATVFTGTGTGHASSRFSADSGTDIENASATFFLIQTATAPVLTADIDSNNDGLPDGAVYAGWTILDSVGITDGNNSGDRSYGKVNFHENIPMVSTPGSSAAGTSINVTFTPAYVARFQGTTGYSGLDWVAADTDGTAPGLVFEPFDVTDARLKNQPITAMGLGSANLNPIPEPGTWLLTFAGLTTVWMRTRRR